MTLPPFMLHRPGSLEEAGELLDRHGDDAAVYCGGTELLLVLKLGLAEYAHLVDLKRIPELQLLVRDDGRLRVGAAVTHRTLERSELVRVGIPALAEMERGVANLRVRNVGTLGGNLCFSDPHSDPATFLLASDAELICRKGEAERTIKIGEFVRGPYETALTPSELLTEIRIPVPAPNAALAHMKFSTHERPALTVTSLVRVEDGSIIESRIAVGSVSTAPTRVPDAERVVVGRRAGDQECVREAGEVAGEAVEPFEDSNGSIEYKRNLVSVFVARCLAEAIARVETSLV